MKRTFNFWIKALHLQGLHSHSLVQISRVSHHCVKSGQLDGQPRGGSSGVWPPNSLTQQAISLLLNRCTTDRPLLYSEMSVIYTHSSWGNS